MLRISSINLHSCGLPDKKAADHNKVEKVKEIQIVDPSIYTIIKYDSTDFWMFKNVQASNLNLNEISAIEELLSECINNYNPDQLKQFDKINKEHPEYKFNKLDFVIDLKRYKRQYVAVINEKGEKEVWVNCFCSNSENDWKKRIVYVFDGGNCYFSLKINMTKKKYYDLMVNGVA